MNNQGYVVYGVPEMSEKILEMLERFGKEYKFVDVTLDGYALGYIAKQRLSPTSHVYYNGVYVGGYNELSSHIFTISC